MNNNKTGSSAAFVQSGAASECLCGCKRAESVLNTFVWTSNWSVDGPEPLPRSQRWSIRSVPDTWVRNFIVFNRRAAAPGFPTGPTCRMVWNLCLVYKTMWFWSRAAAELVVIRIHLTAAEERAVWRSTPRMHCTSTDDAKKKRNWLWNLMWVFTSQRYLWPDLSRTRALPQRSSPMEGSGSQWTRPSYITVWNYSRAGTGLLFWRDVLLLFSFSSSSVVNKPSLLARTLKSSPHFFPLSWSDPAVATATEQKAPIGSALRFEAGVPAAVWKSDVIRHIRAGVSNTVTLGGCG